MSVYRDTETEAVFEHPIPGPLTATVYRDGVDLPILTATNISPVVADGRNVYTLPLSWTETAFDGKLTVVWSATGFERTQPVEVVTPLINLSRLRTLFTGENKSDAELAELEQTVRVFIQAYTGQSFGFSTGSRTYVGTGSNVILLSERLANLTGFAGVYGGNSDPTKNLDLVSLSTDGYTLTVNQKRTLVIKEAPPEGLIYSGQGGVIRVPDYYLRQFDKGQTYTVTGVWGFEVVPDPVQEAAMLLANDFSCNETLYRDRYLQSIKIQQDTITYHPGAFRGTGNARADLLLAGYRRNGMVII